MKMPMMMNVLVVLAVPLLLPALLHVLNQLTVLYLNLMLVVLKPLPTPELELEM